MKANLFKERIQDILIIFVFLIIYFSTVIFNPAKMIDPSQDIAGIFLPDKQFLVSEIYNHKSLPLWNPYISSGEPFVAKPSTAVFYPLNILYFLFPLATAFGVMFILDYFLLGIFTYFFAKKIGVKRLGAIISAITCMFSAPLISLAFLGHIINLDTFIWFPLILLGCEYLIETLSFRYSILTAVPIALSFLAGAPQIAVYMLLSSAIFIALRVISIKWQKIRKILLLYLISLIVASSIAAVQILPTIELSKLSIRANGLPFVFATDFLLHPLHIIGSIFPHFFGGVKDGTFWGKGSFASATVYAGIMPLFLAIYALFTNFKNNKYVKIFSVLALFSVIYAMGKYTPVFSFFYNYIPGFDGFRVPSRFLYIYVFSLSILAGFGFDSLLDKSKNFVKVRYIGLVGIFISLLLSLLVFILSQQKNMVSFYEQIVLRNSFALGIDHTKLLDYLFKDIYKFLAVIFLLFIVLVILSIKKINKKFVILYLILIVFFDLWSFGRPLIGNSSGVLYPEYKIVNKIKSDHSNFRVFDMTGLLLPNLTFNHIENITGVHSLQLADFRNYLWLIGDHDSNFFESFVTISSIKNPQVLDQLSVKYVISSQKLLAPTFSEIISERVSNKKLYLYKNNNFLPEVYLAYVNKESVNMTRLDANSVKVEAVIQKPGLLVLTDSLYPGWKVYDNGKEGSLLKVNSVQKGINLASGKHELEFIYEPVFYRLGLLISSFSFFVLIFMLTMYQMTSNSGKGKIK
ncbi:YfhO family protein [Candidatus Roizmanbacteria bacterium]|nr:YfhO family protein [Candidatus Roizmanbacteria bacterium]